MNKAMCLKQVRVRPLRSTERSRFERLMDKKHYLGWGQPVGETIYYVAEYRGKWVALLVFGAAAYALRDRDAWIGWSIEQRQRRLAFVAQNRRFLILQGKGQRNLASYILGHCTKRLSRDWQKRYGHPLWLAETFVDPQRFEGTCYRAAGWIPLGLTAGAKRIRRDLYDMSGTPKQLFVKALQEDVAELLSGESLPAQYQRHERDLPLRSPVKTQHSRSLWEAFAQVPEFRAVRGRRHPLASVLACATCGVLAGAKGVGAMADVAADMDQRQLRALRCRYNRRTERYEAPSESTLRRVLGGIDAAQFETIVAQWVAQQEDFDALALDGKALRGCLNEEGKPLFLVSAVAHGSGAFHGQIEVDSKSNETPAARELLRQMPPLDGVVTTMDAAHTCIETAQTVVSEKGADYLLPIKGNQPTLLGKAERLLPQEFFSPLVQRRAKGARTS
jgi:hypothetical protein